jgi:ribosome-associated protein
MEETERPSKSQRKRDMTALQKIGVQLVELNADQLAAVELPETLRDAVIEAQRIRDFEGRRRQLQYIGRLMRGVDPAPIQAQLGRWRGSTNAHTALQHCAERWRERLLNEDAALALFAADYPSSDLQRLRSLVASIKRDRAAGRAPKNSRELFRAIRVAIENTPENA